jgi:O-antigen/teichoic acid export membrane protein
MPSLGRRVQCVSEWATAAILGLGLLLIVATRGSTGDAGALRAGVSISAAGTLTALAFQMVLLTSGRSSDSPKVLARKARRSALVSVVVSVVSMAVMIGPARPVTIGLLGESWVSARPLLRTLGFVSGFGAALLAVLATIRGAGGNRYSLNIAVGYAVVTSCGAWLIAPSHDLVRLVSFLAVVNGVTLVAVAGALPAILSRVAATNNGKGANQIGRIHEPGSRKPVAG